MPQHKQQLKLQLKSLSEDEISKVLYGTTEPKKSTQHSRMQVINSPTESTLPPLKTESVTDDASRRKQAPNHRQR